MQQGTIARLLIDKGFGFIRDEAGLEHFFHRSAVRGVVFELLREGQRVEFVTEESAKGPRALHCSASRSCARSQAILMCWAAKCSRTKPMRTLPTGT